MFDPVPLNQSLNNTESHWIEYLVDGLKISGVIAYPKNHDGKKLPVVIYNRGGNMKHNVSRITLAKRLLPIAEQGYLVLASNYRGSRYSEGKDEFGGADVNDVLSLIDIAKTLPFADAEKIALFGWSRGGMMTWQALREKSQDISAAIIGAGVSNAYKSIERRPEMGRLMAHMIPEFDTNKDTELTRRSAIKWLNEIDNKVPILLLHGDTDKRVHVSQSIEVADKLTELNHPHTLVLYPNDNHGLRLNDSDVQQKVLDWLQEHLKN